MSSRAVWRAWYMACTSGPKGPPQLDTLADPAAYTAAPNTWPTGSKPALRMAANSPVVSEDPHTPPA